MVGRQQARADQGMKKVEPDQISDETQKVAMEVEEKGEIVSTPKDKIMDVVCFNCGDVGHYSTAYNRARCCFICRQEGHVVDKCPEWKKSQTVAQFYGSACKGLGFYHIDVEPRGGRFRHWKGLENFGVLTIEQGDIEEAKIYDHLKNLFDDKWEWKLRQEDEYTYIIRFPPQKRVEDLVVGQATLFYLRGTDVLASLKPWTGDVEPIGQLEEVWVQVKGIPPKWADWWTIKDVVSSLGLLTEVDWAVMFSSFFSNVRIKIKCKNPTRVPKERVYELGGYCYLISFLTEGVEQIGEPTDNDDGKGDDDDAKGDDKGPKESEDEPKSDEDPEEDDLLDDEPPEPENNTDKKGKMDKSKDKGGQVSGKKMVQNPGASSSKSVRRSLEFLDEVEGFSLEQASCVDLLKAMELDDEEEEVSVQGDRQCEDDKMYHLPTEWVDILTTKENPRG